MGGPVEFTVKYRLKHIPTQRYLCIMEDDEDSENDKDMMSQNEVPHRAARGGWALGLTDKGWARATPHQTWHQVVKVGGEVGFSTGGSWHTLGYQQLGSKPTRFQPRRVFSTLSAPIVETDCNPKLQRRRAAH